MSTISLPLAAEREPAVADRARPVQDRRRLRAGHFASASRRARARPKPSLRFPRASPINFCVTACHPQAGLDGATQARFMRQRSEEREG
jgi:hypothetical protein